MSLSKVCTRAAAAVPINATKAITQLAIRLMLGDKEQIHCMKTADWRTVFRVYEAMWNTSAYASKGVVAKTFSRLISEGSDTSEEVLLICLYVQFPSTGQHPTPCMDLSCLQRLIALLCSKIGGNYRRLAETTLTCLVACDLSLADEVESNTASDASINVMA